MIVPKISPKDRLWLRYVNVCFIFDSTLTGMPLDIIDGIGERHSYVDIQQFIRHH